MMSGAGFIVGDWKCNTEELLFIFVPGAFVGVNPNAGGPK
jgi:hypothetical protein